MLYAQKKHLKRAYVVKVKEKKEIFSNQNFKLSNGMQFFSSVFYSSEDSRDH